MDFLNNNPYEALIILAILTCVYIPTIVLFMLGWQVMSYNIVSIKDNSDFLEFCWTFLPAIFVSLICYINFVCSSLPPHLNNPSYIKIVGHQWYWSYSYNGTCSYDSLMMDLLNGVDKPLRVYWGEPYTLLVTSSDVIHSFSLPDYNIKIDAIPGRINESYLYADRYGIFVGYCTELCGAGHAYMPIVLEVVKKIVSEDVEKEPESWFSYLWNALVYFFTFKWIRS